MKKSALISGVLFLFLAAMLLHADYVTEGAGYGLLLWYQSVVPSLFPFMVLSSLIVAGGGVQTLMKPFWFLLHPLFPVSENGCYVLVSGLLCGYPMGAKTCADFAGQGRISASEGRFLLSVCNQPSPMFLLGYAAPFLADCVKIPALLISMYAPLPFLAYLAYRIEKHRNRTKPEAQMPDTRPKPDTGAKSEISPDDSILSAAEILCKIGGYLVFFSILIVFLRHTAFLPAKARLCLTGILEMTTGVRELASGASFPVKWIGIPAVLAFGGLSGLFQTASVLQNGEKKTGLSVRSCLLWKMAHAALSAGTAALLWIIFPEDPLLFL